MKDYNGNNIQLNTKCIVDNTSLGLVTGVDDRTGKVSVLLMTNAQGDEIYEGWFEPDRIQMKKR